MIASMSGSPDRDRFFRNQPLSMASCDSHSDLEGFRVFGKI